MPKRIAAVAHVRASIRNLYGEEQPTTLETGVNLPPNTYLIVLPGFGHVAVRRYDDGEWTAHVVQNRDGKAVFLRREAKVVGDRIEVEVLPGSSAEDRIVVCLDGAITGQP